jgi:hypothetical protein
MGLANLKLKHGSGSGDHPDQTQYIIIIRNLVGFLKGSMNVNERRDAWRQQQQMFGLNTASIFEIIDSFPALF